jgi:hypothetical protein
MDNGTFAFDFAALWPVHYRSIANFRPAGRLRRGAEDRMPA